MSEMSLELRHLKLLRAVSEEGSLTRAARCLHLTQSALSHQLRDAERTLGHPLFRREKKQMLLTAAGERLLAATREILGELEAAEREIRESRVGPEGTIRLATECSTCYHWLPAVLKNLEEKYPAVDVQVVVEATREPVPALLDGRIDIGLVSDPVKNSRIALEPLFDDELVAVLASDHRLRRTGRIEAADLAEEELITYDVPREELTIFRDVLVPAGVRPRRWTTMTLTEAMVEMARAGRGIAIMARWAALPHARRGGLILKSITARGLPRRWNAAWVKRRRTPSYFADFVRALGRASRPAVAAISREGTHG